jgi:hypothetical protein
MKVPGYVRRREVSAADIAANAARNGFVPYPTPEEPNHGTGMPIEIGVIDHDHAVINFANGDEGRITMRRKAKAVAASGLPSTATGAGCRSLA